MQNSVMFPKRITEFDILSVLNKYPVMLVISWLSGCALEEIRLHYILSWILGNSPQKTIKSALQLGREHDVEQAFSHFFFVWKKYFLYPSDVI